DRKVVVAEVDVLDLDVLAAGRCGRIRGRFRAVHADPQQRARRILAGRVAEGASPQVFTIVGHARTTATLGRRSREVVPPNIVAIPVEDERPAGRRVLPGRGPADSVARYGETAIRSPRHLLGHRDLGQTVGDIARLKRHVVADVVFVAVACHDAHRVGLPLLHSQQQRAIVRFRKVDVHAVLYVAVAPEFDVGSVDGLIYREG